MIKVLLADDQSLVRSGFRMLIDSADDMETVGEVENGRDAVAVVKQRRVDVVLMDIRMPIMDGTEATRQITALGLDTKVLVLTTFDLDEYVLAAIRAGASGFLLKDAQPEELLAAIRTVHRGDAVIAPSATKRLLERVVTAPEAAAPDTSPLRDLTEREREVLTLMGLGRSNQEIGAELFVAEATVKTHVGRVLSKLGARDRVQAVIIAFETGLVTPGQDPAGT